GAPPGAGPGSAGGGPAPAPPEPHRRDAERRAARRLEEPLPLRRRRHAADEAQALPLEHPDDPRQREAALERTLVLVGAPDAPLALVEVASPQDRVEGADRPAGRAAERAPQPVEGARRRLVDPEHEEARRRDEARDALDRALRIGRVVDHAAADDEVEGAAQRQREQIGAHELEVRDAGPRAELLRARERLAAAVERDDLA